MRLTAHWNGGYHITIPVRDFELAIDEPPQYGGQDRGPMPTEMLLASLAGCFAAAVYHAARKRDITLPDLSVDIEGEYSGLRFAKLRLQVHSSLPRAELEPLVERARSYCYVSNTLLTPPELDVVIAD